MLGVAILLIALGFFIALMGLKLFRVLLPIIGLISGAMVGFLGVQAVFGHGVVSTTLAIAIAVLVGVLFALLSFLFFDIAVIFYLAVIGAVALSYLGVALGLNEDGFIVFLLGLAGAIMTGVWATRRPVSVALVVALTALVGVAYVMTGFMLVVGSVTLDELSNGGVVAALLRVVDDSFLWFLVWIGASVLAMQAQLRTAYKDLFNNDYEFVESNTKAVK